MEKNEEIQPPSYDASLNQAPVISSQVLQTTPFPPLVTQQPLPPPPLVQPQTDVEWMTAPQEIPGCPSGLEYLVYLDKVNVTQLVSPAERTMDIEKRNSRFKISNSSGQHCYCAYEKSNLFDQLCCKLDRAFTILMVDNTHKEVMVVKRDTQCLKDQFFGCCWCACCCADQVTIEAPPGTQIATFRQRTTFYESHFSVLEGDGEHEMLRVKGPGGICCHDACCPFPTNFEIFPSSGATTSIGRISKLYSGGAAHSMSVTSFQISFPQDLDVKMKAALVASTFLLNLKYFETSHETEEDRRNRTNR